MVGYDLEKVENIILLAEMSFASDSCGSSCIFCINKLSSRSVNSELPLGGMGNLVCLEWRRWKLEIMLSQSYIAILSLFQRLFPCFRGCPIEWRHYRHQLPLAHMGNLVCLEWRRRKLEVVIYRTCAMIMSQFQRLFRRFRGCPVAWRHFRHQLPSAYMGNLVCLERRRRKLEVAIFHTWAMIMSQFQRLFPRFRGCPVEWRHYRHQLPLAHMGNLVCLEWRRRKL